MKLVPHALVVALLSVALVPPAHAAMQTATGLSLGLDGGMGAQGSVTAYDFAEGFPFSARASVGLLQADAGDPLLARQVFVNNNTNGTPQTTARRWDLRLDLRRQIHGPSRLQGAWAYFGPRYSMYRATYTYVGGNEVFDVTTNQWGVGGGFETLYPMGGVINLSIDFGLDAYANGDFVGHDSVYSPSNANTNPKGTFTYASADQAVNQPRLAPRFMVGITKRLGR